MDRPRHRRALVGRGVVRRLRLGDVRPDAVGDPGALADRGARAAAASRRLGRGGDAGATRAAGAAHGRRRGRTCSARSPARAGAGAAAGAAGASRGGWFALAGGRDRRAGGVARAALAPAQPRAGRGARPRRRRARGGAAADRPARGRRARRCSSSSGGSAGRPRRSAYLRALRAGRYAPTRRRRRPRAGAGRCAASWRAAAARAAGCGRCGRCRPGARERRRRRTSTAGIEGRVRSRPAGPRCVALRPCCAYRDKLATHSRRAGLCALPSRIRNATLRGGSVAFVLTSLRAAEPQHSRPRHSVLPSMPQFVPPAAAPQPASAARRDSCRISDRIRSSRGSADVVDVRHRRRDGRVALGDQRVHLGARPRGRPGGPRARAQLDQVHRLARVEVEHVADPVAEAERVGRGGGEAGAGEPVVLGGGALERARGRRRPRPAATTSSGTPAPRSGVSPCHCTVSIRWRWRSRNAP